MRALIAVFVALMVPVVLRAAEPDQYKSLTSTLDDSIKASRPKAEKAMAEYLRDVDNAAPEEFRALGFASRDEARSAKLGDPLPVIFVRLDRLSAFKASANINGLMNEVHRVVYPVNVGKAARSTIELKKQGDEWVATALGGRNFIKLFSSAREKAMTAQAQKGANVRYSAVHIPALNLYFLGEQTADTFILIPLLDEPGLDLKAGAPAPAAQVFEKLVPAARRTNGLPN